MHDFADDTNLLNFNSCVNSIKKQVNYDLKGKQKANKISLNVGKTELLLFTSSKKQLDCDLKIKLNGKRFCEADSVKYLGIEIGRRLTWKQQINHVALKLSKANAMLSKLRHLLDVKTLRSVYNAILESHLCYASLLWAQNTNSVKRLHLQKKSLKIMFFQSRNFHTGSLFKVYKILKSFDKTALGNCIFIRKSLKELLPAIFNNWLSFFFLSHTLMHDTRWSNLGYLKIPSYRNKTYGRYSVFVSSIYSWSHLQSCNQNVILHQLKEILITFFLNRYN